MLHTILGKRLRWHEAPHLPGHPDWVFEPVIFHADTVEYTLVEGPHAGRHAVQRIYYQRVAPGIETTSWYEENGSVLHITWYLESQTTHRFAAVPAWITDISAMRGDNRDPAFLEKIAKMADGQADGPRRIISDDGYFEVLD